MQKQTQFEIAPVKLSRSDAGQSVSDKLNAEVDLLRSIPSTISSGIANSARDAVEHKWRTLIEGGSAVALGAGFSLLSKNPNPIVSVASTWAGRAFMGLAVADLGLRVALPMHDLWNHPKNLQLDKTKLGDNLGDAVFTYGLVTGEGALGAQLGERFLSTSKIGEFLQGYKEVHVKGDQLNDPVDNSQPQAQRRHGITNMSDFSDQLTAAAGVKDAGNKQSFNLPEFSKQVRLRTFSDGTQVAFDKRSVRVSTADGVHLWFKHKGSFLGLNDSLGLSRVVRIAPEQPDHGLSYVDDLKFTFGKMPDSSNNFFARTPGGNNEFDLHDGLKLKANARHSVMEVDTPTARVYSSKPGTWNYSHFLAPDSSNVTDPAPFLSRSTVESSARPWLNLTKFTSLGRTYEKGFEGAIGEMMIERGVDIGTGIFEHDLLTNSALDTTHDVSEDNKDRK